MPTEYGTVGFALNQIQVALQRGVLEPRVVVHPFAYMAYGPAEIGKINRMALGWKGDDYSDPGDSPAKGSDITSLSLKGVSAQMGGKAPEGLPANRFFMGAWKIIYDGSNQGYTGYFKTPGYYDPEYGAYKKGYNGMPNATTFSKEVLEKTIDMYHAANQSVEVHTNGSWAAEDYVTALEKAVAAHPEITDTRDCAIHGQMMERQHIERLVGDYSKLDATKDMYTELSGTAVDPALRAALQDGELMKKQNLVNSYFVNHAFYWGDRHMEIFMGPGRAKNMNPCGWSAAYDLPFSVHNDTTVTPISPLRSMQDAITRISSPTPLGKGGTLISGEGKDLDAVAMYPETKDGTQRAFWNYDQRVNVLQALHAITIVPAYQNHMEDKIGSIAPEKFADFTILDQDPFKIDPATIASMRVTTTIVGDKPVYGVLPDSETFAMQIAPSYDQPNGTSVLSFNGTSIDNATADKDYAPLPKGSKRLGTFAFTAETTAGKSAVFQMNFLGNGATVGELSLHKLYANKTAPYAYGKPSADELPTASGMWWVADIKAPTKALAPADVLEMDHTYMAFFIIADNDATFDIEPADGVIKDPVSLATTGPLPNNGNSGSSNDDGGSSSGCTVGSTPSYDLLVLLLIQTVGQSRGSRFIHDTQNFQTCDLAGILGSLTLRVGEVSRNGDNRLIYRLAEVCFCVSLQLLQDHSGDLLRRIRLAVDVYAVVGAHVTLDGNNGTVSVGYSLALSDLTDHTLAVLGKCNNRRSGARTLSVRDDYGFAALHNRYTRVRRTKVNTNDLTHNKYTP